MTRKSKIARLPRSIRDELNRRLDDGQPGIRLVDWLNSLPEVKQVLTRDFQGRCITSQNLSEWKRGGYNDWIAQQECSGRLQDWLTDAKELGEAASPEKLNEAMLTFATVHYAAAMHDCDYRRESREKLRLWSPILNDIIRLRQCGFARQRLELDEQRIELNRQRLELDRSRLKLPRLQVELDRQRLDPVREVIRAPVNPEAVPALNPGLRRDAGRYPGESSRKNVSNPERVESRTAQDPKAVVNSLSALLRNTEHETRNTVPSASISPLINQSGPAKSPLKINIFQANPTKSNHPFFMAPPPAPKRRLQNFAAERLIANMPANQKNFRNSSSPHRTPNTPPAPGFSTHCLLMHPDEHFPDDQIHLHSRAFLPAAS